MLKLYRSLVRPNLENCLQARRPQFIKDVMVQKMATRFMVRVININICNLLVMKMNLRYAN